MTAPQSAAGELPVDLRPPAEDPWEQIGDTSRLAAVARAVARRLPELAEEVVRRVFEQVPGYVSSEAVSEADLRASAARNMDLLLRCLAEDRPPTGEELRVRRALGRRRADQNLPIADLGRAYRIGYQTMWDALAAEAPDDRTVMRELAGIAPRVWEWLDLITGSVIAEHRRARHAEEAELAGARQRLAELLATEGPLGGEAARHAAICGFRPADAFRAVVVAPPVLEGTEAVSLQAALEPMAGTAACVTRGATVVVLLQGAGVEPALAEIEATVPTGRVGVGAERTGLDGARLSLRDARAALELAGGDGLARFEDSWLWALLAQHRDHLGELLAPGVRAAEDNAHLAAAVEAFAGAGFAVAQAARSLDVHPNTVAYRLDRWEAITGWDPRTFAGLVRSLAALRLPAP